MLQVTALGAFEITCGDVKFVPTAQKERTALALLALSANTVVGINTLIDEIWGSQPPKSCVATARTYIYHLRQLLDERMGSAAAEVLATRPPGYLMWIPRDMIDANVFQRRVAEGRAFLDAGQPECATECLRHALSLWNGQALANVPMGPVLRLTLLT